MWHQWHTTPASTIFCLHTRLLILFCTFHTTCYAFTHDHTLSWIDGTRTSYSFVYTRSVVHGTSIIYQTWSRSRTSPIQIRLLHSREQGPVTNIHHYIAYTARPFCDTSHTYDQMGMSDVKELVFKWANNNSSFFGITLAAYRHT